MATPYYQDDLVTLYNGDCREVLPTLERDSSDLIVTDPPYGQSYLSNRGSHAALVGDDGALDIAGCLSAACRTLRRGRHAYVFGPLDLAGTPLTAQVDLIWDKQIVSMGDLSMPWSKSQEPITFAVYEPSKANRDKGYGKLAARLRQGSVLRVQRTQGAATTRHPTEKPVPLLRQLIESSSVFGETVLDPFAGVSSTLVAAVLEGRRAVGIEIDEHFCELGAKRLQAVREQIKHLRAV
jgi:site-specific DNA-methyltransferase (adenine-specific)